MPWSGASAASLHRIDFSTLHALNSVVAARDWLEDPAAALAAGAMPVYLAVAASLWFVARPYGSARWRLASASALVAAGLAVLANQAISRVWDPPGPSATHPALTHVLSKTDSFPSDRTAVAFAVAFAVLAFSRRAGAGFLAVATLIGVSLIAVGIHYPSDVLLGTVVGCAAAMFATEVCAPWIEALVTLVGRVTDPLLATVWDLLGRQLPLRRY